MAFALPIRSLEQVQRTHAVPRKTCDASLLRRWAEEAMGVSLEDHQTFGRSLCSISECCHRTGIGGSSTLDSRTTPEAASYGRVEATRTPKASCRPRTGPPAALSEALPVSNSLGIRSTSGILNWFLLAKSGEKGLYLEFEATCVQTIPKQRSWEGSCCGLKARGGWALSPSPL